VLEALGIPIHLPPAAARAALARDGAVFLFAPDYHPAFKAVAGVRKKLAADGVRTVFNILGPLLNPARPTHQLAGVFSPGVLEIYPPALRLLGRSRAWVVHGTAPGAALDEISTAGPTHVRMLNGDKVAEAEIDPATHGVPRADLNELTGDDAAANARIIVAILDGSAAGPQRDLVVVNAAGALCAAGLASDFGEALERAARLVRDGDALRVLRAMQASA
jgi:anthranilate phosphoribosyltransferase